MTRPGPPGQDRDRWLVVEGDDDKWITIELLGIAGALAAIARRRRNGLR